MDLISINDDKFPAKTSKYFMELINAALNCVATGFAKWAL